MKYVSKIVPNHTITTVVDFLLKNKIEFNLQNKPEGKEISVLLENRKIFFDLLNKQPPAPIGAKKRWATVIPSLAVNQ